MAPPKTTKKKETSSNAAVHLPENKTNRIGQVLIVLFLVYPWIYLTIFPLSNIGKSMKNQPYTLPELGYDLFYLLKLDKATRSFAYIYDSQFWMLIMSLSLPHVFYYLVWTQSRSFFNFAQNFKFLGEPFQVMAKIAHVLKIYQLSYFFFYFFPEAFVLSKSEQTFNQSMSFVGNQSVLKYIILSQGLILGQILNGAVYAVLGEAGVYYGTRLGKKIPWVTGFPYNVLDHGQYIGATISIVSFCLFLATDYTVEKGIYGVIAAFIALYSFSSWVESTL